MQPKKKNPTRITNTLTCTKLIACFHCRLCKLTISAVKKNDRYF